MIRGMNGENSACFYPPGLGVTSPSPQDPCFYQTYLHQHLPMVLDKHDNDDVGISFLKKILWAISLKKERSKNS